MTAILWLRNDLRLDDNTALLEAIASAPTVLPVYVFDDRQFGETPLGFPKTGGHRARFLVEAVAQLRTQLDARGGMLVVRRGLPEKIIPALAKETRATHLAFHTEVTDEERRAECAVREAMKPLGTIIRAVWGSTLYHRDDLPYDSIGDLPEVFTHFRKNMEKNASVRVPIRAPDHIPPPNPRPEEGTTPSLAELGLDEPPAEPRAAIAFRGGEAAAQERLDHYFWESDSIRRYKETRNGLLGADYSSKFSPWLAHGCISPRRIFSEVREYERQRVANNSTYWLVFELIWRDFFRFVAMKHGSALFKAGGIRRATKTGREGGIGFQKWAAGNTGEPFVDANMRELARTGFMSNRGRQNVASYLVHDLGVHWRWGAEWFESQLVDYDPCSNWGNWNYVAGVGNDPREGRRFNIERQQSMYDPKGDYRRTWLAD